MTLINPYMFAANDPFFANVSLLLHGDGANGSTTIVDSSPSPKTVTAVGGAQISTAQSKFGGASIKLDAVDDYLQLPNTAAMALDTSDFTLEAWIQLHGWSSTIYGTGNVATADSFLLSISSQGGLEVYSNSSTVISSTHATTTIPGGTGIWHHVALTRSGSDWKVFLNGAQQGVGTRAITCSANSAMYVGARDYNGVRGGYFSGYIDDFRITKSIRYTANFSPPTSPFPDS